MKLSYEKIATAWRKFLEYNLYLSSQPCLMYIGISIAEDDKPTACAISKHIIKIKQNMEKANANGNGSPEAGPATPKSSGKKAKAPAAEKKTPGPKKGKGTKAAKETEPEKSVDGPADAPARPKRKRAKKEKSEEPVKKEPVKKEPVKEEISDSEDCFDSVVKIELSNDEEDEDTINNGGSSSVIKKEPKNGDMEDEDEDEDEEEEEEGDAA